MQHIDPRREQFDYFKSLPRDTKIMMLNLIKLNQKASYTDREATGAQAYADYGKYSAPIFKRVGGKIIWRGKPESVLIGPQEEFWDIAFIAQYPNSSSFLEMVSDPEYQAIVFHRQAAVKDSRLIRMGDSESSSDTFS